MTQEREITPNPPIEVRNVTKQVPRFEGGQYHMLELRGSLNFDDYTFLLLRRETKTITGLLVRNSDMKSRLTPFSIDDVYQIDDRDLLVGVESPHFEKEKIWFIVGKFPQRKLTFTL